MRAPHSYVCVPGKYEIKYSKFCSPPESRIIYVTVAGNSLSLIFTFELQSSLKPNVLNDSDHQHSEQSIVGLHSDLLISRGLGGSFFKHFGVLGHHFNTTLMMVACKGSLKRDLECSRMEFDGFSIHLGSPIGDHSGSFFRVFSDLK